MSQNKTKFLLKAKVAKIDDVEIPLTGYVYEEDAYIILSELQLYDFRNPNFSIITEDGKEYFVDENGFVKFREETPDGVITLVGKGTFDIKIAPVKGLSNVLIEVVLT